MGKRKTERPTFGAARQLVLSLLAVAASSVAFAQGTNWPANCTDLLTCLAGSRSDRGYLIATKIPFSEDDCYLSHTRLSQRTNGIACIPASTAKIDDTMIFFLRELDNRDTRVHFFNIDSAYYLSQKLLRGTPYHLSYLTRDPPGPLLVDMHPAYTNPPNSSTPKYALHEAWKLDLRGAQTRDSTAILSPTLCSGVKLPFGCVDIADLYPNDMRWWLRMAQQDGKPGGHLRLSASLSSAQTTPPQYFTFIPVAGSVAPSKLADDLLFQSSQRTRPVRTIYQKLEFPVEKGWTATFTEKGNRVSSTPTRKFPETYTPIGSVNLNLPGVRKGLTWDASKSAFVLGEQLGSATQLIRFAPAQFEGERQHFFNTDGEGDFALVRPDNGQRTDVVVELQDDGTTILHQLGYKEGTFVIETRPLCVGDDNTMVPCENGSTFDLVWVRGGSNL